MRLSVRTWPSAGPSFSPRAMKSAAFSGKTGALQRRVNVARSRQRALEKSRPARAQASMSKLFCSEAAFGIADKAVQIHGGEGIVQGRRVEFLFRMLRMYRVLTGTSEIQRNTIAKELLMP